MTALQIATALVVFLSTPIRIVDTDPHWNAVYTEITRASDDASPGGPDQVPILSRVHATCAACTGRAFYAEVNLEPGSTPAASAINFESSVVNRVADPGYQIGVTALDNAFNPTAFSGQMSSTYRATAGNGGGYGCTSGVDCFPIGFGYEVVPNGTQFHIGMAFEKACCIDRDVLSNSSASTSFDLSGSHDYGIDMLFASIHQAAIRLPTDAAIKWRDGWNGVDRSMVTVNAQGVLRLGLDATDIQWGRPLIPPEGAPGVSFRGWLRVIDSTGNAYLTPVYR